MNGRLNLETGSFRAIRRSEPPSVGVRSTKGLPARKGTGFMTLKVAVLTPTRKAIVTAAVSVKIGLFRSVRPANAKFFDAMLLPRIP